MDTRLFRIVTRPGHLRQQDLPDVARALVSLFRGLAVVKTGRTRNIGYVRIETPNMRVQILAADWALIMPHIENESLNQVVVKSQVDSVWLNQQAVMDSSIIDRTDRQYYLKVLGVLQGLFPESYPTT